MPGVFYLFDAYIKPVQDFGDAWLTRLAGEGLIADVSVTLLYFLMTHGVAPELVSVLIAAQMLRL